MRSSSWLSGGLVRHLRLIQFACVLTCLPGLIFPDQVGVWLEVCSVLGLALVPILGWLTKSRALVQTPVDDSLGLLLLLIPLNLLVAADRSLALPQVYRILSSILVFYSVAGMMSHRDLQDLGAYGICFLGLVLIPILLFGTDWGSSKFSWLPWSPGSLLPRVFHPFWKPEGYGGFNVNMVGGTLAMVLPVPLAYALFGDRRLVRLATGFEVVLVGVLLLLTQSRGAVLGVLVGVTMILMVLDWRWALVALLVVGGSLAVASGGGLLETGIGLDSDMVYSAQGRFELWTRAWYMMQDFTFTGIGLGMVPKVLPLLYPTFLIPPTTEIGHLHNLYLHTGAEMGFPGLVVFLGFLSGLFVLVASALRTTRNQRPPLLLGVLGSLVVVCVHGLVDNITYSPVASVVAWGLFGTAAGVSLGHCRSFGDESGGSESS